ncbi:OmpA family protein [uncultured Desulfosarcina sp.]|uniref:OmpA family protein n=1 Tax=uncultured Desulfosarcina sp. TaxID=218289 RepID=UPI0029C69B8E|nr:OmpA family protein [uncultured Desulfosarcina sp.]
MPSVPTLSMRALLTRVVAALCLCCVAAVGAGASSPATRAASSSGEGAEAHLPADEAVTSWIHDPAVFREAEGDRTEMREGVARDASTVKLYNLVPPIHFRLGEAEIPADTIDLLRGVLERMRDRTNVRLHFIGHTDTLPLTDELVRRYGDNVGLSQARAATTAEYCQRALGLPPEAISYEGMGDTQPVADNLTDAGRQHNRRVEVQVWYDEISERPVAEEVYVPREVHRIKVCRTETVCKLRYKDGHAHRARVKNMVTPLHYDEGMAEVPGEFLRQIQDAMANLHNKQNLVAKFIAYTDNLPLMERDKRIYGDHRGLSKAVARRISLAVQEGLHLPNTAVESDGMGVIRPVAANDTQQGRALNRRVEVEFWYDDPLKDLPDEPQLCPEAAGADTVARVYDASSGGIAPILFEKGQPVIPPGYTDTLGRVMDEISDKANVRLRFVGFTGNRRLDRRTAMVYGDDVGLSMARARRAMEAVKAQMGLRDEQVEVDGRGYVQADDVVNAGFIESDTSRVQVQVVYDELIVMDAYDGVEVTPLTREVTPADPFALNHMRITVDGQPIDDPGKCSSDIQRCTDVALEQARIQFKHDSLTMEPRLNITAWPNTIRYQDLAETPAPENRVHFRMYCNYRSFIQRAEVRIFAEDQSVRDAPLAVVPLDADGMAHWQAEFETYAAPGRQLQYLVRVVDRNGRFDETLPQPLWVVDRIESPDGEGDWRTELLAGYGESRLAYRNIPLRGGTVQAYGMAIPQGHKVWMAGFAVPVDSQGRFIAEEILPEGIHTVEVAVLDERGNGELFLRDLALKKSDWFTVGIADITAAANRTNGPADLLAPDRPQYSEDMSLHGRLAFYTNGKFKNGWTLTASADTREGPLDEIFSNFMDKSPDALFRRMDPDYHYPTFGDDSTVAEEAPTSGKFYVKAKKDETYGLWGNFKVGYTDNSLAHVDRGLYGANLHYQPLETTSFGEPRLSLDGFAADPGTVAGRDEFRGTGGSLYFMHRQDILEGSERMRIEVRDKDSGMVLEVKNLTALLDYDIDYLQGRVLLTQPLPTTADDGYLVDSGATAGHPVYLVVRYEYTPGFDEPDTVATGGRVHYWFNDHIKMGVTASQEEQAGIENSVSGADLTFRKSASTWLKLESGATTGPGVASNTSLDGGYNFGTGDIFDDTEVDAAALRVDASINFQDFFEGVRGRTTLYHQELEAGYSAPGQTTDTDTTKYGGTAEIPVTDRLQTRFKMDKQVKTAGLETEAMELDVDYALGERWSVSSGVRQDSRQDNSPVVPATQEEGDRTDANVRLSYDSRAKWTAYSFVQETVQTSGNRAENSRVGAGGSWRLTDRFKVVGEASGGDLGMAGLLGTEYLYSDRTTMYTNYTLENERSDDGVRARRGNMTSGFKTHYSDSASVYLEEQYAHGDVPTGLTHSTGVELAPVDHLNFGANLDFGTLQDPETAAEIERRALGVNIGYGLDDFKISSGLEYRVDNSEQPDESVSERTTWLFKNSLKYQVSPDWRVLGKFNYSESESSLGESYSGDYTEAVVGCAYRPVNHDRLNALLKYTYFYNLPAADQASGTASEVIQRSHIFSMDMMYDLTRRLTVGGKFAYRLSQVAQDRENPEYFDSNARLYVLRADYHILERWDALIEARQLDLPDAQDRRSGFLVGLYRHLGKYIKLGVGYNFSDFSDDLTQMSYTHQGFFVNLIGKY